MPIPGLVVPVAAAYARGDIIDLIMRTTLFAKIILVILFAFSVACWAIILERWWAFRKAERLSTAFLENFRRAGSLN